MRRRKINLFCYMVLVTVFAGVVSCSQEGEANKLFKSFNQDDDDYLGDQEFYSAIDEMGFFKAWNRNGDQSLNEDEWAAGVDEYLGGYEVSTVEKFGEWDLNGDEEISIREFREGLLEVVDTDDNGQISESEFVKLYEEGGRGSSK